MEYLTINYSTYTVSDTDQWFTKMLKSC